MIIGVLLFQAVAFAVLSGIVANKKSRDPVGWGLLGLVFGLFGFIAALVVEEVESEGKQPSPRRKHSSAAHQFNLDEHEKKCPMCAEYIKLEARRCKYCGHEFSEDEVEQKIEEVKKELTENRPREPKEKKAPKDLEVPPPDEVAARCGDCHYPLRGDEKRCPRCQSELVWS